MRVVPDSNVVVSALVFGGTPDKFLQDGERTRYQLVTSEPILLEIAEVLSRKFHWNPVRIEQGCGRIRAIAELVVPSLSVFDCPDPDDNRILEAAVEGRADFIVSGDKHLLRMNPFRGIEICVVREFLLRLNR